MLAKAEEEWHQGVVLFNTLPLRHFVSGSVWPCEKKFEGDVGKFPERQHMPFALHVLEACQHGIPRNKDVCANPVN